MQFTEGEIYQGGISITGGEGTDRRWIVVAPFGKRHLQSIDAPTEIHYRPLHAAERGLREGRLERIGFEPQHPVLLLQRMKEEHQISDTHLGLRGENLEKMLHLLHSAAHVGESWAPFVAGEILSLRNEISIPSRWDWHDAPGRDEEIAERVTGLLEVWRMKRQEPGVEFAAEPAGELRHEA
ncbi:hypothetical protein [Endothiovibrio diazotrophicus]